MRPGINENLVSKRYAQGDEKTWADICRRVAHHAGANSGREQEYFDAINSGLFFPSRMTYMGTDYPFASSCFVFPVEDSLAGIMKTLSDACQVQKYGGGTGYNFSHLRPKGDLINTSKGEASGPVSFMKLFHNAMEVVHRAGKKHAAQMGILNCDHPDIFEFIHCKDVEGALWTFNISVGISDAFFAAVDKNDEWELRFGGRVYRTIQARDLWKAIVQHAWGNGDPGVIFLDTVNRHNRYPEKIEASNPCGEQMLPPYVSCNLGSIDLSCFVADGQIDWDALEATTRTGVRFLDDSISQAFWPVAEVAAKTQRYKNIGLGVMGWADMLILLGIQYDSDEAVHLADTVMQCINDAADRESIAIGNGTRKNTTVTSIAPTGSISMLAGCSSGIEPVFGIVTTKNTYVGSQTNAHWIFEQIARERGFYSDAILAEIARTGSVQQADGVPDDVKTLFKTANEIGWQWHVKHQAAFQVHTDNAVSKTINLANSATVQDVAAAYRMAFETGCKSTTVYRDGSRQVQVLDSKTTTREICPNCNAILFMSDGEKVCVSCGYKPSAPTAPTKRPRPSRLRGTTYRKETPLGRAYITVNSDDHGEPLEVFLNVGKAGSETSAVSEAIGRLISLTLRMPAVVAPGERLRWIVDELAGIGGGRPLGFGPSRVRSLPDGIAQVLTEHMGGEPTQAAPLGDICPDCGEATLLNVEGCRKCAACGYSEC